MTQGRQGKLRWGMMHGSKTSPSPVISSYPSPGSYAFDGGDDDGDQQMIAELLPLRRQYRQIREGLDRLKTEVLRQSTSQGINIDDDDSHWRDRARSLERTVEDLKAQLGEQVAAGVKHRQWSRSIKEELAKMASMLQERDEEAEANASKLRQAVRKARNELEAAKMSNQELDAIAKKAREDLQEAENRRRIAEAAASTLEEELQRHHDYQHHASASYHQRPMASSFAGESQSRAGGGGGLGAASFGPTNDLIEQKALWEGRHKALVEENTTLKVEIERLKASGNSSASNEAKLEKELEGKAHDLGRCQERLRLSEEEITSLRGKIEMERVTSEKEIMLLRQSLARNLSLEEVADQRSRKIDSLKALITSLEDERKDLRNKLRKAEDGLEQRDRQFSSLQSVIRERDQQISSLEPCRAELIRLREENANKVGALTRLKIENESLQRELQRLSQELVHASSQLSAYEKRLCLLEESALKDREREAELHSARKGLIKNRMMVESLLMKELSKMAHGGGAGGGASGGGGALAASYNNVWSEMADEMLFGDGRQSGDHDVGEAGERFRGRHAGIQAGSQALPPPAPPSATPSTERGASERDDHQGERGRSEGLIDT